MSPLSHNNSMPVVFLATRLFHKEEQTILLMDFSEDLTNQYLEGSKVQDYSGRGNNGVMTGRGSLLKRSSLRGLYLGELDYVKVKHTSSLTNRQGFTLEAWVNVTYNSGYLFHKGYDFMLLKFQRGLVKSAIRDVNGSIHGQPLYYR